MNKPEIESDYPSRALSWKDVKIDRGQVGNLPPYRSHTADVSEVGAWCTR